MQNNQIFIVGANGQLGTALRARYPSAQFADITGLDISNRDSVLSFDWSGISTILNAAAFTNVDGAETPEGRVASWRVNASAVSYLSEVATEHGMTLVHVSTDYVFDGTQDPHTENESFSPLSVYGASKAAGDVAVSLTPKHYILRTSWVIGEGKNFVRTMLSLGKRGINPSVVNDQIGRLTFTAELVRAISHLLENQSPFGTYNVTNSGNSASWADITRQIFKELGLEDLVVSDTTSSEYYANKQGAAMRPLNSTLDLNKLQSTGFVSRTWEQDLNEYIKEQSA